MLPPRLAFNFLKNPPFISNTEAPRKKVPLG
jgi:hypothetical protein